MDDVHFRRLERMYEGAACNAAYGPRIEIAEGRAAVRMPVRPEMLQAAGAVHGHVIFKMLDDAAFFAANSVVREVVLLTASLHVEFLRPVAEGELRSEGSVVQAGQQRIVAESTARDAAGREVARGIGTFFRSRVALGPGIGYA